MRSTAALFAVFAALLALGAPLRADHHEGESEKTTDAQRSEKTLEKLDKRLKLTADQKAKLKPIVEKADAERREMHEKFMKAEREHSEKIRALLTDEQKEKYDVMRAKRRMQGHGMRKRMKDRKEDRQPSGDVD